MPPKPRPIPPQRISAFTGAFNRQSLEPPDDPEDDSFDSSSSSSDDAASPPESELRNKALDEKSHRKADASVDLYGSSPAHGARRRNSAMTYRRASQAGRDRAGEPSPPSPEPQLYKGRRRGGAEPPTPPPVPVVDRKKSPQRPTPADPEDDIAIESDSDEAEDEKKNSATSGESTTPVPYASTGTSQPIPMRRASSKYPSNPFDEDYRKALANSEWLEEEETGLKPQKASSREAGKGKGVSGGQKRV